jgi:hypothetical protein
VAAGAALVITSLSLGQGPGTPCCGRAENLAPASLIRPCVGLCPYGLDSFRHPSVARAGTRRPAPTWAADTSGRRDVDVTATTAWERWRFY